VPLLPDEPPDRQDEVGLAGRAGGPRRGEPVDVDPGRRHLHALRSGSLEEQRCPRPIGCREKEIGRC
jgi:hypothetical protein